jgi:hypothetical protein
MFGDFFKFDSCISSALRMASLSWIDGGKPGNGPNTRLTQVADSRPKYRRPLQASHARYALHRQLSFATRHRHTAALANEGAGLAAAWPTIQEIGDRSVLAAVVEDAFSGARVAIRSDDDRFVLQTRQPGLLRPLGATELPDGTLRYLLWIATLLSPRPPAFLVLNEPEASLHSDLRPALYRLAAQSPASRFRAGRKSNAGRSLRRRARRRKWPKSRSGPLHTDQQHIYS